MVNLKEVEFRNILFTLDDIFNKLDTVLWRYQDHQEARHRRRIHSNVEISMKMVQELIIMLEAKVE